MATATMNQMGHILKRAIRTQMNVKFLSQPALGKTTLIEKLAAEVQASDPNFFYLHRDGGTLAPTDTVMAMPNMAERTIDKLVDAGMPNFYDSPDMRGMIYVGEWPLMGLEVSKGFQKLLNHEDIGGFRVPPGVIFVADGQRLKDRSGAQQQSRAIESRFVTYELEYDADYALEVVKAHYHQRVAAFCIRNPGQIDNYSDVFETDKRSTNDLTLQEGKLGAWASLRSWDKVSRILRDADSTGEYVLPEEIQACVGSGIAATFDVFCKMLDNLTTLEQIINDPKNAKVPQRMDEQYALSTMLALTVDKEKFPAVATYMQRFVSELQAAYFRLMNERLGREKGVNMTAIRTSKEYKTWITAPHISKMLMGAASQ
jgi:hypothetical protein